LALGHPGDAVVVSRSLHRSMFLGLVMAVLRPVRLPTQIDSASGLPLGTSFADAWVTSAQNPPVGYAQASLAAARTERLDRDRLDRGFEATQTTSPAGAILASSDASRALMETRGVELFDHVLSLVRSARERIHHEVAGLLVPDES